MTQRLADEIIKLRTLNRSIKYAEAALEELSGRKRTLETEVLPAMFAEAGVRSWELPDGGKATLSTKARGSLPKEPELRKAAIDWLVENGHEGLIEAKITASWNRSERDKAIAIYEQLRQDNSVKLALDEGVNHMTLSKMCKDAVTSGQEIPLETLGVVVMPEVLITKEGAIDDDQ
jgi:hypothetical protein